MRLNELEPIRFLQLAFPIKPGRKTLVFATLAAVFLVFGDSLLPLFGHGLYLLMEVAEQASEDLLEYAFGLSTRQAQILLVWVGLPILFFILGLSLRKPLAALKARWIAFWAWVNGDWSAVDWFRVLTVLALLIGLLNFIT